VSLCLGGRAVLATGFERIHRSNLIGMGILPLRIPAQMSPAHLKLGPGDMIENEAPLEGIEPHSRVRIRIHRASGDKIDAMSLVGTSAKCHGVCHYFDS